MWEKLFDHMMATVFQSGSLKVNFPSGRTEIYGDGTRDLVEVSFTTRQALRQLLLNPDLYAGETYMDGTMVVEGDDLRGFLSLIVENVGRDNVTTWQRWLGRLRTWKRRMNQRNRLGIARKNVAHHYDLSGALYDLFLDTDKQYSCAYFRTPQDTLEQAQAQKKAHIGKKLLIEKDMTVLDIGCGWGGMGLTLARDFGARVVGVTLSEEQHKVACARAKAEGLDDRVEFRLQDYREVPETFDRIVSVGMFEHVGVPHYEEYFGQVRNKLNDGGVALIHTIGRVAPPGFTNPWVLKYIFPGGYVPSMSEALVPIENQDLYPTDIEVWRLHYAETLRHWHERFMANYDRVEELYDARFCRMWRWYLVASEMTFRYNRQCVFQFQLAKKQEAVPLTREYLCADATGPSPKRKRSSRVHHAAE
ncbi:Cyclopropane-fatty-acyl-phospholipid synthase [Candidatus Rhodobacter oscarellae]|uniref:Cyclopropane-fatty-acyl-phospholipid synthase n=1 Tax=Candidatus Rhodobacter oscarellae TaxID=1675527 RepID=A0A0J9H1F7_9RHOB|nr:cyclopropane-fatty-acyl-phospholipid synthase family protein [Candidatus Rhodobacter lobularis]KMW59578.1 Cyclopropane-fatty-acyl-phospholipid synthase [Candidatus Rhodobacter lobularis]